MTASASAACRQHVQRFDSEPHSPRGSEAHSSPYCPVRVRTESELLGRFALRVGRRAFAARFNGMRVFGRRRAARAFRGYLGRCRFVLLASRDKYADKTQAHAQCDQSFYDLDSPRAEKWPGPTLGPRWLGAARLRRPRSRLACGRAGDTKHLACRIHARSQNKLCIRRKRAMLVRFREGVYSLVDQPIAIMVTGKPIRPTPLRPTR